MPRPDRRPRDRYVSEIARDSADRLERYSRSRRVDGNSSGGSFDEIIEQDIWKYPEIGRIFESLPRERRAVR